MSAVREDESIALSALRRREFDHVREREQFGIAVKFGDGDPGLPRILEVQEEISGLFRGRKVDLSVLNRADPLFMKKIAEQCEFLSADPGEAAAFLLMAFRRYQDHRKYLDMERDFAADYVISRNPGPCRTLYDEAPRGAPHPGC